MLNHYKDTIKRNEVIEKKPIFNCFRLNTIDIDILGQNINKVKTCQVRVLEKFFTLLIFQSVTVN